MEGKYKNKMKNLRYKILKYIWPIIFIFKKKFYFLTIYKYENRLRLNYRNYNQVEFLNGLIFILDENFQHGGLVDKTKGFVSAYYLSKILQIDLYVYISDDKNQILKILNTSVLNVLTEKNKLSFSKKNSKPVLWYNYQPNSKKNILRILKQKRQIHLYCNMNILSVFKKQSNEMIEEWSSIFNQIFIFNFINIYKQKIINNKTVGIHLRFMDMFGDFEDLKFSKYSQEYKKNCLDWCINQLINLINHYTGYNFLIISDSKFFLDYCKKLPIVKMNKNRFIINSKQIGHIFISKESVVFQKAVSDFISLSYCSIIFQIRYGKMHNSDFSRYSSFVNKSEFILMQS
jgi:hypothetical protein